MGFSSTHNPMLTEGFGPCYKQLVQGRTEIAKPSHKILIMGLTKFSLTIDADDSSKVLNFGLLNHLTVSGNSIWTYLVVSGNAIAAIHFKGRKQDCLLVYTKDFVSKEQFLKLLYYIRGTDDYQDVHHT